MARRKRAWVSQDSGAYHIISRVVGGQLLFGEQEKEYFLKLLEVFAQGFFVDIHGFTIMGNHVLYIGNRERSGCEVCFGRRTD